MSNTDKVRENRLRRMAERQGLRLVKSHRRDPRAIDFGRFTLVNPRINAVVAGTEQNMDLDQVEAWLTEDQR